MISLMSMPVMNIRIVGMAVAQGRVNVEMIVRLGAGPGEVMGVLMMGIMHVPMVVRQFGVRVFVLMALGQV